MRIPPLRGQQIRGRRMKRNHVRNGPCKLPEAASTMAPRLIAHLRPSPTLHPSFPSAMGQAPAPSQPTLQEGVPGSTTAAPGRASADLRHRRPCCDASAVPARLCGPLLARNPIPKVLSPLTTGCGLVVPRTAGGCPRARPRLRQRPATSTCSPSLVGDRLGGGDRQTPQQLGGAEAHFAISTASASAYRQRLVPEGTLETLGGAAPVPASFDLWFSNLFVG